MILCHSSIQVAVCQISFARAFIRLQRGSGRNVNEFFTFRFYASCKFHDTHGMFCLFTPLLLVFRKQKGLGKQH